MLIPEEYDGLGLDTSRISSRSRRSRPSTHRSAVLMSVHNSLPTQMILRYGTDEQKERFLKPMARGELLGAFALSEPEAGSDAASLTTQAVRDGDDWVLNGTKSWVTSGSHAGVILAMARTDTPDDRKGARGIGTFIVTPDLPGFHVGQEGRQARAARVADGAAHASTTCACRPTNLLGEPHMGFIYAMQSLDNGRLGIAAQAVGIARAALEAATRYAARASPVQPADQEFQAIQFKLADMATQDRGVARAAARRRRREGSRRDRDAVQRRWQAVRERDGDVGRPTQAVQIFGGYGYVKDYPVERLFRDAKVTEIYEGTSEIQRIVIARELYAQS